MTLCLLLMSGCSWCFIFLLFRENDVIISKDKWHSGAYSFINGPVSPGMLAHPREDHLDQISVNFILLQRQLISHMMQLVGPFASKNNNKTGTCTLHKRTYASLRKHSSCQRSASSYFTLNIQTCFAAVAQHSLCACSLTPMTLRAEQKCLTKQNTQLPFRFSSLFVLQAIILNVALTILTPLPMMGTIGSHNGWICFRTRNENNPILHNQHGIPVYLNSTLIFQSEASMQ